MSVVPGHFETRRPGPLQPLAVRIGAISATPAVTARFRAETFELVAAG